MKLHLQGPNQTAVSLENGTEIFFSYRTPVAAFVPGRGYIRTAKFWSATTARHIAAYCGKDAPKVDQKEIDRIAEHDGQDAQPDAGK